MLILITKYLIYDIFNFCLSNFGYISNTLNLIICTYFSTFNLSVSDQLQFISSLNLGNLYYIYLDNKYRLLICKYI